MTRRNVLKGAKLDLCHAVLAIAVSSCLFPVAAHAQAMGASATYNIPASDLASAVDVFSRQSGLQILYKPELLAGKRAKPLSGSLSGSDALARLLKGSDITWEKVNDTTYVLRSKKKQTESKPAPAASSGKATISASDDEGKVTTLSEILVVGSKSLNVDARRTRDDVQPYVTFSREDIERSMASNIEEFLTTRLPMNQTQGTKSRNVPEGDEGNRSGFNLRGLGENQTLILINGRRAPGVSTLRTGDLSQPDLNGVPLSAIERIEVLPTTASGIYGGGATGGVINVILRKDYIGSEVQFTYDNTFDTDSARNRIDFSSGMSLEQGRTHVMLSGSYSDGNDLLVRDRDYAERGRSLLQQNNPLLLYRNRITGTGTNIYNNTTAPLVLRNGTSLGSNIATVPFGYVGGDGGLGLLPGAGRLNIDIPNTIAGGKQSLSAVPETKSINVTARRDLHENVEGFIEYGKYRNKGVAKWAGFGSFVSIPATSAANPFRSAIRVSFPLSGEELERSSISISDSERLNVGLIIKLPREWSASVDANWTRSKNTTEQSPSRLDTAAIQNAVRAGTLNVFRDLEMFPIDLSPYVVDNLNAYGPAEGSMKEYAARAAGPAFKMPARDVQVAALISTRREQAESTTGVNTTEYLGDAAQFSSTEYRFFPSRYQDVRSAYAEASFPLIASHQNISLVRQLDLQASVRYDEYRTVSVPSTFTISLPSPDAPIPAYTYNSSKLASTDFTIGLKYRPFNDLTLRASYGTGFLPPSLAQISYEQFNDGSVFLSDPKRGGVTELVGPLSQLYGGSSAVKPEHSESYSAGLILTPSWFPGLRLSVDYTRIDKTDEMTVLSAQELLDLEDSLPGRVVRGDNLPDDPAGYAGVITQLDLTLFNTAKSKMEAVDAQLDYSHDFTDWGELQLYGIATLQNTLESQAVSTAPTIDKVGYSNGPLRWRGNVGVVWKKGAWNASINTQWYDDYRVYSAMETESNRDALVLSQGSERISSQSYTDVSARYTVGSGPLDGLQISAGVRNIFNDAPPTIATSDSRGGYSTYGDPRGRTYVLSVKKAF